MIDATYANSPNCHSERSVPSLLLPGIASSRFPSGREVEEFLFATLTSNCHSEERIAHSSHRTSFARRGICFSLLLLVFAAAFASPLFAQAPVQSTDRAKALGNQLMCTCGCGDTAGSCSHPGAAFSGPCDVAKGKLKEMNERIGRGESDKTILQAFVQEFGESALAAPPARGFNWFAYTFPGVAFAIGLFLVIMVIRVWRHRPPQMAPASGPAVSPEMLEHARRQIERDVQDD